MKKRKKGVDKQLPQLEFSYQENLTNKVYNLNELFANVVIESEKQKEEDCIQDYDLDLKNWMTPQQINQAERRVEE